VNVPETLPRAARLRRRLVALAVLLAAATVLGAGGCAQLAQKARELTFRVVAGDAGWYRGLPAGVTEIDIPVEGEAGTQRIHAWWWKHPRADAPAVLYLHGSRWNLTGQLYRIEQLHAFGFSVLAIDYRGFGRSEGGMPSEATVYTDAQAAWQALVRLEPDPSRRFIYGHSLGGAVAIDLASRLSAGAAPVPARGLVVESTFTTLADVARALSYEWLPVEWILSQKFDSAAKIGRVRLPVLVVHGASDRYVPPRFSRVLYEAAPAPKQLLMIDGGTHNNSMRIGADAYRDALQSLFGLSAADATTEPIGAAPAPRTRARRAG
jgi:alpha-beta hydrolase superfamily lysophospholipase